ncbi:capsid protein [Clostridium sp.]|uniref:capsid protein n=1 Tax=Clostridium sp. TaxID=1506 RepID=UPI0034645CC4
MFDKLKNGVRKAVRGFLNIQEAPNYNFMIQEGMNYEANAFKNMIWYRGDSYELNQLYKQMANYNYSFWGSVPTVGLEIRKIHTGLPKIIVNQLVNIVLTDLNIIEFKEVSKNDLWKDIVKENKFNKLLERATREALVVGDGAFKISFDSNVSDLPILEFYSGEKIDIVYDRGRVKEIIFQTNYTVNKVVYTLHETYGFGYVTYKLFKGDSEVNLKSIPQTENLVDVTFDKSFCMAVPYMIYESDKWEGRGQSIFDSKCDNFDSLDETWSQWIDALRAGRAKTYIPDDLLPRNPNTGEILKPSYFDNRYIQTDKCMKENVASTIDTEQPIIPTENYISTYVTALDLCLQGIISPSTLGIDNKKLDNAEAQREKEKTTLYTRSKIIEAISDMLPTLIDSIFKAYNTWLKQPVEDNVIEVSFGEYASPSFEAVVETLSNPNTPMSIEAKVEEMWGDSKTEEWKKEEVERIKEQTGVAVMDEPSVPGYDEVNLDNENSLDGEIDGQE